MNIMISCFELYPYSKLKVQDGFPTESLWLMFYASIILDSDVEVEAQVQEPEQGEASGDVWGVGLEDIFVYV